MNTKYNQAKSSFYNQEEIMMKLLMLKNTYEYIAVREPFSFSLNQITMCILSPVKDGVISQGNLAITP